jgi:hypothetical protein
MGVNHLASSFHPNKNAFPTMYMSQNYNKSIHFQLFDGLLDPPVARKARRLEKDDCTFG